MDTREKLNEFGELRGLDKNKLIRFIDIHNIAVGILREEYADFDINGWHYEKEYKMLVKAQCRITEAGNTDMRVLSCDSCGCHPNVIYTTKVGKFCENCKPATYIKMV